VRHKAGLAFGQEAAEHLIRVSAHTRFNQKAGKVRARNQLGVACVLQRTLERPVYADRSELIAHFPCALVAPTSCSGQTLYQGGVVRVKTQTHDVDGDVGKRH
jgi:hypothetical protein